jgi:hypothetical protein
MASSATNPLTLPRFEAGCQGKEEHASEAAALAALKYYQTHGSLRTGDGLEPYRCEFGEHWHLGHGCANGHSAKKRQDAPGRFSG